MNFKKSFSYDDGGRSKYYRSKKSSNDCVVRSIAIAFNQDYKKTLIDLCNFTIDHGEPFNSKHIYEKYLFSKGWVKYKTLTKSNNKKYRISELPLNDNCLISTRRHLTVLLNHTIRDLWDTRGEIAYNYYIKNE